MADFPSLCPNRRTYSLGSVPVDVAPFPDGSLCRWQLGDNPTGHRLRLEWFDLESSDRQLIEDHWHGQQGGAFPFGLPTAEIWAGNTIYGTIDTATTEWRYAGPPRVGDESAGRADVAVELVGTETATTALTQVVSPSGALSLLEYVPSGYTVASRWSPVTTGPYWKGWVPSTYELQDWSAPDTLARWYLDDGTQELFIRGVSQGQDSVNPRLVQDSGADVFLYELGDYNYINWYDPRDEIPDAANGTLIIRAKIVDCTASIASQTTSSNQTFLLRSHNQAQLAVYTDGVYAAWGGLELPAREQLISRPMSHGGWHTFSLRWEGAGVGSPAGSMTFGVDGSYTSASGLTQNSYGIYVEVGPGNAPSGATCEYMTSAIFTANRALSDSEVAAVSAEMAANGP